MEGERGGVGNCVPKGAGPKSVSAALGAGPKGKDLPQGAESKGDRPLSVNGVFAKDRPGSERSGTA